MGYRSDVAYIIGFKSFEDRDAFVGLMLAKNDEATAQAIEETDHERKDRAIITFHEEDVKWYDTYPEVQAHTRLYREANALYGAAYKFVSVGEDGAEDSETEDSDDDKLSVYDDIYTVHKLEVEF